MKGEKRKSRMNKWRRRRGRSGEQMEEEKRKSRMSKWRRIRGRTG